jgi:hypothetical protein
MPFAPCQSGRHHAALQWQEARDALPGSIRVVEMTIDDSWLRDTAPTVSARAWLVTRHLPASRHLCHGAALLRRHTQAQR